MSGVVGDIKKLFKFKIKARSDGLTDQYHRLLMTRAFLVGAFLTGLTWYKDEVKCVIPKALGGAADSFGPKSCWINGFYVYKELMHLPNFQGYYGLPNDMDYNGTRMTSGNKIELCIATIKSIQTCKPMQKIFYLQYQWFPFYMAAMALLFYLPYVMYQFVNTDIISFKNYVKKQDTSTDDIIKNFFNRETNTGKRQLMRVFLNILVKASYLLANICAFSFTNSLLNGQFSKFGSRWFSWGRLSNYDAHNYVGERETIKPGELLLPVFGFCDVLEGGVDVKYTYENENSFLCEISQHVLYHYVLIAIWVFLVIGFVLSIVGLIWMVFKYVMRARIFANEEIAAREVYNTLSAREAEYLDLARRKNVLFYGALIRHLHALRYKEPEVKKPSLYYDDSEF